MNLEHLSSETLTARMGELLSRERRVMVAFLFHLAELERRQLHLAMGFSSVFVYCTDALHLSKASAFRRTAAARLLVRFPVAAEYLESGALCLTTLVELRDALTDENHQSLLQRAAGKTEDEVRDMIAALRPKPAPTDLFRRVPMAVGSGPEPDTGVMVERSAAPPPTVHPKGRLEPISEELRVLRVTVSREFADDLAKVRALLSHKVPDGNLEKVLHECIRLGIHACEKRRRGGTKPRGDGAAPPKGSRYLPVAVTRAVWDRDGGRCSFVSTAGQRCGSDQRGRVSPHRPVCQGRPVDRRQHRLSGGVTSRPFGSDNHDARIRRGSVIPNCSAARRRHSSGSVTGCSRLSPPASVTISRSSVRVTRPSEVRRDTIRPRGKCDSGDVW